MRAPIIAIALLVVLLAGVLLSFENEKLVVFGTRGRVEADVATENGLAYVNLGGILLSEGDYSTKPLRDGLRYELAGHRIEAHAGARDLRADNRNIRLDSNLIMRADQAWIPMNNVAEVLRAALKKPALLRNGRLLIGDAGDYISTEYRPGDPSTVVLHFSEPVNPVIDTSEGKLTLSFRQEPIVMATPKVDYGDKTFQKLEYTESGGAAQITFQGAVPLMARYEDGNRRIVITAAPAAVASAPSPAPATTATTTSALPTPTPETPAASTQQPQITGIPDAAHPGTRTALVAIDPAHGGNDAGVKFSEKLLEKNVSLAIAEKLKTELNNRGITTILLRSGDDDVNPDDRADAANGAHVSYYIAIHAGQMGSGVRVFTPLRTATVSTTSLFKSWDAVQADQLDKSTRFAAGLTSQFADKKIAVRQFSGNAAPLTHVAAAAISIEVAPEHEEESSLESAAYIQKIAQAVASAVAQEKARP